MRQEEERCCRALEALLISRGVDAHCVQGPDPPDAVLTTTSGKFAVEITSIHGITNLDGKDFAWTGLVKDLLSFGACVCDEVEAKVAVPGCFVISFPGIPQLRYLKSGIVGALVQHFQASAGARPSSYSTVFRSGGKKVSVWKVKDEGSALVPQALPTGSLVGPRPNQLDILLTGAVNGKAQKLKRVADPKILVIDDQYLFQRSAEEWRTCLSGGVCPFQAVIRVQCGMAELICGTLLAT